MDLLIQQAQIQQQMSTLRRTSQWTEDQQHREGLHQQSLTLSEQIKTHVGQYYPEVLYQVQRLATLQ